MKAMYVSESGCIPYAAAIVGGYKTLETRNRDMLKALVGERVAVIRTRRGKPSAIVGAVDITGKQFVSAAGFRELFSEHLVQPGSKYDATGRGKWCYSCAAPKACDPIPLPPETINHGRSWCEIPDIPELL